MSENKILLAELQHLNKGLDELHQVIIGIRDSPKDNGMIGDVEEILAHLKILNGQVHTNTTFRKIGTWVSCTAVTALIGMLAGFLCGYW